MAPCLVGFALAAMTDPAEELPRLRNFPWLKFPGGTFGRSVLTLASGTALAQLAVVLSAPVLTRLYTPAEFGTLAVYSSVLSVLLVVASLRYESAIPLPAEDDQAASLLALTLAVLAGMTVVVAVLVWLFGVSAARAANVPELGLYRALIPLGFLGAGAYQLLALWAIRRSRFRPVARTRVGQGVGQVVTQVTLGALGTGTPGLLLGDVVGRVAGSGALAVQLLGERPFRRVTGASLRAMAYRYRRFPLVTTWAGILNIGSLQLPAVVFSAGFGAAAAGLYALSFKMLVAPTMLLGQAVGDVFLSRAAPSVREPERLRQLTERTAITLFACGLPAFGSVALGGPQLFAIILGNEWETAGRYAQILSPWFVVWLVSSPLSRLLSVREWQLSALAFTGFEFLLRLGALLIGVHRDSPLLAVALLSASGVIISVASIVRFMRAGFSSIGRVLSPAARLLALAALCLLPAGMALYLESGPGAIVAGGVGVATYYIVVYRAITSGKLFAAAGVSSAVNAK
ncbi:MAG TPA: oligosaccharide flippase family protein [Gemmatimonadales bacterium]|nr:oligosaccharide flippase family protein [Gemmatimonadales bacterium]